MELDQAITQLQQEMDLLGTPKEGSKEWWLLRSRATGHALLTAIRRDGLNTTQSETFRKDVRTRLMKLVEALPVEAEVVK